VTAVVRPLVVAAAALLLGTGPVSVAGGVAGPVPLGPSLVARLDPGPAADLAASPRLAAAAGIAPSANARDGPQGMPRDERTAVAAVDGFWKRHFAEYFGQRYHSPLVVGGYRGTRGPSCDSRRPLPYNAFYCRPSDYLALDQELMSAGYQKIGRAWVYLIIAHEWGHAIQARLSRNMVSVAAELQADCLAGAELAGAQRDRTLVGDPGDAEQIARTLAAVSDDFPWTKQTDHGDVTQRISAYRRGFLGGVPTCFPA
jgi:hypothetical protein